MEFIQFFVCRFPAHGKQEQFVVYVELGEDGRVDFQTNAATGQFNSYSVSINYEGKYADNYHTGFSLKIKYADKNEAAITLWIYSYKDFEKLLKLLEIDLSNAAKDFFYEQYSAQLSNAGNYCDKLDVLYENIPPFVVGRLNKEQRWQSLKSLLGCVIDDGSSLVGGTDEEEAVINKLYKAATMATGCRQSCRSRING